MSVGLSNFSLQTWAEEHDISETTINTLRDQELTNPHVLLTLSEKEVEEICPKLGAKKMLQNGLKTLKEVSLQISEFYNISIINTMGVPLENVTIWRDIL